MKENTLEKIGTILDDTAEKDAVHFAVLPVISADDYLFAGTRVRFVTGSTTHVKGVKGDASGIGVVDPFITDEIKRGDRFFILMNPNTITSLRHEWTHPALAVVPAEDAVGKAIEWMQEFAHQHDTDYDALVMQAHDALISGDNITFGVDLDYDMIKEFWANYALATGRTLPTTDEVKLPRFGCAC